LSGERFFGGIYCLHLQDEETPIQEISLKHEASRRRRHDPPKSLSNFTGLPGVVSQKMKLLIVTAVKISNLAQE
jgi:hypothetical protein